jgi:hypothetical protein
MEKAIDTTVAQLQLDAFLCTCHLLLLGKDLEDINVVGLEAEAEGLARHRCLHTHCHFM